MKKYLFFILAIAGIWACSKEDWPDNSAPERNWLAPEEGAMDETSILRREFYERNGVYLLFSDTLGVREKITLGGEKIYEYQLLKRGYTMIQKEYFLDSFVYDPYMNYAVQKAAAEFIEKQLLPNISEAFWPNAMLLLDRLEWYDNVYGNYKPVEEIVCHTELQAMVIALGDIAQATEKEREAKKNTLLQTMVLNKSGLLPAEDLELFYSYSKDWYKVDTWKIPDLQAVGLLKREGISYYTTDKDYDLSAFIEQIFSLSKEEFYATYSAYPLVIKKMEVLVSILQKYGVKIYMEE